MNQNTLLLKCKTRSLCLSVHHFVLLLPPTKGSVELQEEKMFENMVKEGLEPNFFVYGALINAFAKARCVEEVE